MVAYVVYVTVLRWFLFKDGDLFSCRDNFEAEKYNENNEALARLSEFILYQTLCCYQSYEFKNR